MLVFIPIGGRKSQLVAHTPPAPAGRAWAGGALVSGGGGGLASCALMPFLWFVGWRGHHGGCLMACLLGKPGGPMALRPWRPGDKVVVAGLVGLRAVVP